MFSDSAQNVATTVGNIIEPQTLKLAQKLVANRISPRDVLMRAGKAGVTPAEAGAAGLEIAANVTPALGFGGLGRVASAGMMAAAQPLGNKGKVSLADLPPVVANMVLSYAINKLSGLGAEKAMQGPEITQAWGDTAQHANRYFAGGPADLQARAARAMGQTVQTGGFAPTSAIGFSK